MFGNCDHKKKVMSHGRKINFAPGPSALPLEVLEKVHKELFNYNGSGMSILELSHRSALFADILNTAKQDLKELLKVPDNYHILFLQGGGTGQTAASALNLIGLKPSHMADYMVTGAWSAKAAKEASKYGKINHVFPKMESYTGIPDPSTWTMNPDSSYVFYCDNETIDGIEFPEIPETNGVSIICDMSSNILSRCIDISKFGVIYAGAQKNLGTAGVTLVIVRDDLLTAIQPNCLSILDYSIMSKNNSLLNTPPVFSIYVLGLMVKYVKENGGLEKMEENSRIKSNAIYSVIDESDGFYKGKIDQKYRSRMNVVIRIGKPNACETLEKKFIEEAAKQDLISLKGHRSVGGIRISLYNSISIEDAEKLVEFMKDFQKQNS